MVLRGSVEYIALLCQRRNIRIDVSLFFFPIRQLCIIRDMFS